MVEDNVNTYEVSSLLTLHNGEVKEHIPFRNLISYCRSISQNQCGNSSAPITFFAFFPNSNLLCLKTEVQGPKSKDRSNAKSRRWPCYATMTVGSEWII